MKRYTPLFEDRASLYHTTKIQFVLEQLNKDEIKAVTTQRFWPDGYRRIGNASDYYDSFFMSGLSSTRNIEFAKQWGPIIYKLNQDAILHNYKVIPFNWGYSSPFQRGPERKKEFEEFIVCNKFYKTYRLNSDNRGSFNVEEFYKDVENGKQFKPLSKYLEGIYLSKKFFP